MDRLRPENRPQIWRFDLNLRVPLLSDREDVRILFRSILDEAMERIAIKGLDQSSFSYDVPEEGGIARISGYLHSTAQIYRSAVQTWIFDERIIEEIEWTAVLPGQRQDWKQQKSITDIFAECDDGSRLLEDWRGDSSASVNKGGRPRKVPAPADGGDESVAATAPKTLGRPRKPQPVDTDTPEQAAVRERLIGLDKDNVKRLCSILFPGDRSWAGKTKYQQVEILMKNYEELARTLHVDQQAAAVPDTPEQAALRAKLQTIPFKKWIEVCSIAFPPDDLSWRGVQRKKLLPLMIARSGEVTRVLEAAEQQAATTPSAAAQPAQVAQPTPAQQTPAERLNAELKEAVRMASMAELKYICDNLNLAWGSCVVKSDYPNLFRGKVDAMYITEAVRIIRACGSTWQTIRPTLPPPRGGPCAAGAVGGRVEPLPSPAAAAGPAAAAPPPPPPPPLGASVGGAESGPPPSSAAAARPAGAAPPPPPLQHPSPPPPPTPSEVHTNPFSPILI